MPNDTKENTTITESQSLLSEASLLLSLSPPRAPPYYTIHRYMYTNHNPASSTNDTYPLALHPHHHYQHTNVVKSMHPEKKKYYQKIYTDLISNHHRHRHQHFLPHPHLSFSPNSADQITRCIGSYILPLHVQNKLRDNGTFRSLSDNAIALSIPTFALFNIKAAKCFLSLTRKNMIQIQYGNVCPDMQKIDLFVPNNRNNVNVKGLIFFVHGGAWGSGKPWMYRLVASSFIQQNIAVAIVGYRTYPDGNVQDQVDDLNLAAQALRIRYPHLWRNRSNDHEKKNIDHNVGDNIGVCLMGHSSGAHISMLYLIQQIEKKIINRYRNQHDHDTLEFDSFVGLSGVYNIQHHFDYEAGRGVEEISPMKPACGYSRSWFDHYSPALKLYSLMKMCNNTLGNTDAFISTYVPPMLLVHGMEDETVPFTSTSEAARIIQSCGVRKCNECYLSQTGHADVIMHFMIGGQAVEITMKWLKELESPSGIEKHITSTVHISSKL